MHDIVRSQSAVAEVGEAVASVVGVAMFFLIIFLLSAMLWGCCGLVPPFCESQWLWVGPGWTKCGQVVVVTTKQHRLCRFRCQEASGMHGGCFGSKLHGWSRGGQQFVIRVVG